MKFYDVYPIYDIEPVKGLGCKLWDKNGIEYLDLFGGHGVISIGHSHPYYLQKISKQINDLIFYSNSFKSSLKDEFAEKLGRLSEYDEFDVFLVNSGAEAIENALKIASFQNGRKKVITLKKAFHGRTTAAIAVTDIPEYRAPINNSVETTYVEINKINDISSKIKSKEYCAVIIEGIQGVGGIHIPEESYIKEIKRLCESTDTIFIIDEIQSGYGRSGKFFAHQYYNIKPDIITIAKGMANGIPAGGVLVSPKFKPVHGRLGSTFGGNQLACAGGIAVLEIMENENLIGNAERIGSYLKKELEAIDGLKEVRGRGLMIGLEFENPVTDLRNKLLYDFRIFTGSSGKNIIRLLPPLCVEENEANYFLEALRKLLRTI